MYISHLVLSITATKLQPFSIEGTECTSTVRRHSSQCTCKDDTSTASAWVVVRNKKSRKNISKSNLQPYLLKDIILLEKVQKRVTKFILNDYTSNYKHRLISLYLLPLMYFYELQDILFFIKNLQQLSDSFKIYLSPIQQLELLLTLN